jgi:hypothetical protein
MPPPISSHAALCFGVASTSCGNQTRGAEMIRPSARTTFSVSVVHVTSTAVASRFSTKALMPFLEEGIFVLKDNLAGTLEFTATGRGDPSRQGESDDDKQQEGEASSRRVLKARARSARNTDRFVISKIHFAKHGPFPRSDTFRGSKSADAIGAQLAKLPHKRQISYSIFRHSQTVRTLMQLRRSVATGALVSGALS